MQQIKKIDIKEFRQFGFLLEVNRLFFHPLGMALEVIQETDGTEKLGGIWDYRDNPQGIIFQDINDAEREKIARVKKFADKKHKERNATLGYIIQPSYESKNTAG